VTSEQLDEVLRALAHPVRRRFVKACLSVERAAGDLAGLSNLSIASASEHLKVLRKSGLLLLDRRGRFWMYRTDLIRLADVADTVGKLGEG
jgi:DNA-binding transcriptional ArsR family regulator